MKIGVVRQRYIASGGAERYLDTLVQHLAAAGHEIHIFARQWESPSAVGIQFHRVPMVPVTSFLRAVTFATSCQRLLDRSACDLVFSFERTLKQDLYRAGDGCHREWLRQRRRFEGSVKTATLKLNPLHLALLALEKRTFSPRHTGWIIANSKRGKDEIVRHYQFPAEKISVIYNGVDCSRFQPALAPVPDAPLRLLFVGTGFERKGLRFCIQLLPRLPFEATLQIVGKGDTQPYQKLARSLGVASKIQFLGYNLDTAQVYPTAHLLLHPAIYEPFANVCLEAFACGLPVITSRINGVAELIQQGRNGAVVEDPSDLEALSTAVQKFADPARRRAAAPLARATAEQHPIDQNVRATLDLVRQLKPSRRGK
jgi:UDP-glucose:(heptosyl)LPS alpha-1,3-glucosyltransferase